MARQLFTNNALSQVSGVLPQGGTTLVCTSLHGSRFPTPSAGDFFYLTIYTKDTYGVEQNSEIVKVTSRVGDVFTIVRDIEAITGQSGGYAYDATTDPVFVEMRWTAGCVNNIVQKGEAATIAMSGSYTDLTNKPSFGTASLLNEPVSGNAVSTELVKGNDTRLTDSRLPTAHNQAWNTITGVPTTLLGYGITNAYTKTEADTALASKLDANVAVGDVTGQSSSVDDELALFSGTTGKIIKRATTTGLLKATSGVISTAIAGTDFQDAMIAASQAEMEAGTETAIRSMSPLRVTQAIEVLAGAKLIRSARTFNTTLGAADKGKLINITSGTFTQTFDTCATLGDGWWCYIRNNGTGDITLDPNASETIDALTSFIMYPGEARLVQCDGVSLSSVVLMGFFKAFQSSGSFLKPPGYSTFTGYVYGAGGGGGRSTSGAGGGGGGGCTPFALRATDVSSGYRTVTVGAGGLGGSTNGASGGNGGSSSFIYSSYDVNAGGGKGGLVGNGAAGGEGGYGVQGFDTLNIAGCTTTAIAGTAMWGGGGGGASVANLAYVNGNKSLFAGAGGSGTWDTNTGQYSSLTSASKTFYRSTATGGYGGPSGQAGGLACGGGGALTGTAGDGGSSLVIIIGEV